MKRPNRVMTTLLATCGAVLCSTGALFAQVLETTQDQQIATALGATEYEVVTMDVPKDLLESFETEFSFEGMSYTMELSQHSIRSDDFRFYTTDVTGRLVHTVAPASRTYRGTIDGLEGSQVSASLSESGQLSALILLDEETTWEISPLSEVIEDADDRDYIVFDSLDVELPDFTCGVEDDGHGHNHVHPDLGGGTIAALQFAEIALDADYEMYQKNGSSENATIADLEDIMAGVDLIYQRDCEIGYIITTIIVRTSEPDPYTSTNPGTLLGQFQNHWNGNHQNIQRDVAHLFTGKNLNGGVIGVAYLSVICQIGSAYGLSESRFTGNRNSRIGLTAHELGHNWSAPHCDGNSNCRIMCSGLGGCSRDLTKFAPVSINRIVNYKNGRGCLDDEPGYRLELSPSPPWQGGSSVEMQVLGGVPLLQTAVFYSTRGQGYTQVAPGIFVDLQNPKLVGVKAADTNGDAIFPVNLPNVNLRVYLQGVQSNALVTNLEFVDIQ